MTSHQYIAPAASEDGFSIEPSWPDGEYTLYRGRGLSAHGYNLCTLSEFDSRGAETRQMIVDALNRAAPEARVVGACVVRKDGSVGYAVCAGNLTTQAETERETAEYAKKNGGTAHRLHLGDVIGGAK